MMQFHKISAVLAAAVLLALSQLSLAQERAVEFKLKPGAYAKLCQECHDNFKEKLKKPFVHTPVKKECTGCHNPHTSSNGKFLLSDAKSICLRCHKGVVPENALSVHKPVAEGGCMKCHDPHSANNKNNLLLAGNALCLSCHKTFAEGIAKVKFKHSPVEKGCTTCHDPHAARQGALLKNTVTALCTGCHRTDRPVFLKQHMNYPVANSNCVGCHDPHGSDQPGLLYNNVHRPVASRMCNQCHNEPNSKNPLAVKKEGFELCRGCHNTMMNESLGKKRLHWPMLSKAGCLSCHSPHAAPRKGLLKASQLVLCGKCHADTIKRQEKSPTKHEPVQFGMCTSCHDPHASDTQFLAKKGAVVDMCGTCHDWMKHSTHPIGDKVIDPRNRNLTVQCLSCHRSHGTEYKHMLPFPTTTDLCVECHEKFRR